MHHQVQPEILSGLHSGRPARRAPCPGGSKGAPLGGRLSCGDRARGGPRRMCADFPEKPFQQVRRVVQPSIPPKEVADADQRTRRHWRVAPLYLEVVAFRAVSRPVCPPRRGSAPLASSTPRDCLAFQALRCFWATEQRPLPCALASCRCLLPRFRRRGAARLRPFDTSARLPGNLPLSKRHLPGRYSKGHLLEPP